ncbi:MAG: SDR family NAD(P)-dependent oxidoreductase [Pirellulales bacterium]
MNNTTKWALAAGCGLGLMAARRAWLEASYGLAGRTVLVTGGSRGLGLLLAREFAAQGARLIICARNRRQLQRARDDLESRAARVLAVVCDVTDEDQVRRLVRTSLTHFGRIDVLVNNAGTIQVGPMEVMTLADYQEAMKTHFWGPLYTTLAVLPHMRWRGSGRIVNISSIGGKLSMPHLLPYGASKFALVGLSQGLRAELAKDGIKVTTVCPGLMRTGSHRNAWFKGRHRNEYAWFSISDSLPIASMSAQRAARQVVAACRRGDAEVVLSLPAAVAARFHGLFPGLTADLLGWVNRMLPEPGGIGSRRLQGSKSRSSWSPSWLTRLADRAAVAHNEV